VRSHGGHLNCHRDPQRKFTEGSQGGLLLGRGGGGGGSVLLLKFLRQATRDFEAVSRVVDARPKPLVRTRRSMRAPNNWPAGWSSPGLQRRGSFVCAAGCAWRDYLSESECGVRVRGPGAGFIGFAFARYDGLPLEQTSGCFGGL
jgi:hypothetical protein